MNKKQGTPVIIRTNESGSVIAIAPTLRGHMSNPAMAQLLTAGVSFGKFETVESFMDRTEPASNREVRDYLAKLNKTYSGNWYAVETETPSMRKQRMTKGY